jgi:HK97 family phage major capsid protein
MEDLQKELDGLKKSINEQLEAKTAEVNSANAENVKAIEVKHDTQLAEMQKQFDALSAKVANAEVEGAKEVKSFSSAFAESIKENFDGIKNVSKGRSQELELKAVGNMTVSANLTGTAVNTYQPGVVALPSPVVNFRDLVPQVSSNTGLYVMYRETGSEGSISSQGTPGASKTQIDYDFTASTFTATYISGFARYAKQMAQDLPFLQSALPQMLIRDFYKAENSAYYTALAAAATASTTAKTVDVEQLIDDMGTLEASDYMVNGIVLNPKDWANIALTKPNDYSLPGIVAFVNGQLFINGIPVYKASWIPVDKYLIGDWSQAKNVVVDGLKVEFFEQDGDNVTKNLITARVEAREVLAIDRPAAFILGDFGNVA